MKLVGYVVALAEKSRSRAKGHQPLFTDRIRLRPELHQPKDLLGVDGGRLGDAVISRSVRAPCAQEHSPHRPDFHGGGNNATTALGSQRAAVLKKGGSLVG